MKQLDLSIIIVGKICSGKSTLAKDFAKWIEYPTASFGGYLYDFSVQNRLPIDRIALQDLGVELIKNDHVSFLNNVINFKTENEKKLIFEGVRHKVILDEIRKISKQSFAIYLDVSEETRLDRFIHREKEIDTDNAEVDFFSRSNHPVEQELDSLKEVCNFTITTNDNYQEFLKAITLYR